MMTHGHAVRPLFVAGGSAVVAEASGMAGEPDVAGAAGALAAGAGAALAASGGEPAAPGSALAGEAKVVNAIIAAPSAAVLNVERVVVMQSPHDSFRDASRST
jgi:hypothetical protein